MGFSSVFLVITLIASAQAGYSYASAGNSYANAGNNWQGFPDLQMGRAGFPQLRMPAFPAFPNFPSMPFRPFPPSAIHVPTPEELEKMHPNGNFNGVAVRSKMVSTTDDKGNVVRSGQSTIVTNQNGKVNKIEVPLE